jgi:hypothetical protein
MPLPSDRTGWLKSAAKWGGVTVWAVSMACYAGRDLLDVPLLISGGWLAVLIFGAIRLLVGQARGRGPRDTLLVMRGLIFLVIGGTLLWFGIFTNPNDVEGWQLPPQPRIASARDYLPARLTGLLPPNRPPLGPGQALNAFVSSAYIGIMAYGLLLICFGLRSPAPDENRKRRRALEEVTSQTALGSAGDASEAEAVAALQGKRRGFKRGATADDREF